MFVKGEDMSKLYDLEDVHKTAAEYLSRIKSGGDPFYQEEKVEVVGLDMPSYVALRQAGSPPFFYGFKPNGRPVFTHDTRLAKSFKLGCLSMTAYVERLRMFGIEVNEYPTVWVEGKNINE
jgi:hypothetical protein